MASVMTSAENMLRTRACEIFGIEHPVFLGPMGSATGADLAAAVSNAGGLGMIGCAGRSPEWIAETARAVRDPQGVPHLTATNLHDLFFAQGYVTAQDRLWQMDVSRRFGQGELAEIFGPRLLPLDKRQRTLQIKAAVAGAEDDHPSQVVILVAKGIDAVIEVSQEAEEQRGEAADPGEPEVAPPHRSPASLMHRHPPPLTPDHAPRVLPRIQARSRRV